MAHEQQERVHGANEQTAQAQESRRFDYNAPAELFPSRGKKGRSQCRYKRFDTAAEALRFAMEEMPDTALLGAYLEVDEARFGMDEIRSLYNSAAYPLRRARKG